jgi:hypothetical protein
MTLLPIALLGVALCSAEEHDKPAKSGKTMTMTGCLNKGEMTNHYSFTDQKTGKMMTVTGSADLEKHSSNHTVKLTGSHTAKVFNATKVEHVAPTCEAKKTS